jgi:glycine/D-amino acid oxidase-like deaminating enzyme
VKYSALALLRGAVRSHRYWAQAWRSPGPKGADDGVVVRGGGHGLAAAYDLAKNHGLGNVAVIERGWLGGTRPRAQLQREVVRSKKGIGRADGAQPQSRLVLSDG